MLDVSWVGFLVLGWLFIYLAQVSLGDLFHFGENHGGNLLRVEGLNLTLIFNFNLGFGGVVHNLERPVLHVRLNHCVIKLAPNQTLGILGKFKSKIKGTLNETLNNRD